MKILGGRGGVAAAVLTVSLSSALSVGLGSVALAQDQDFSTTSTHRWPTRYLRH